MAYYPYRGYDKDIRTMISQMAINVKSFGAKGDGSTDDTAAINSAVQYAITNGAVLWFPAGTYMVLAEDPADVSVRKNDLGGIIVNGAISIYLHPSATLKAITNSSDGYAILNIRNATDVYVKGGKILGERTTHVGVTGQWGHGIQIRGSQNVHISDVTTTDCWGDGIYVGNASSGYVQCTDIYIDNIISDGNRRQALTIADGARVYVTHCQFSNSNGQTPQLGVDIEPNAGNDKMYDIFVTECVFSNNSGGGITVSLGDGAGAERINISDNTFNTTQLYAIYVTGGADLTAAKDVIISGNVIEQDITTAANSRGIRTNYTSNVIIANNDMYVPNKTWTNAYSTSYGIYIGANSYSVMVSNNQVTGYWRGLYVADGTPTDLEILNNSFVNCGMALLFNAYVTYASVRGNRFNGVLDPTVESVRAKLLRSVVAENAFKGVLNTFCIKMNESAGCVVSGNVFMDNVVAISSTQAPSPAEPNVFRNNTARFNATPYDLEASNIASLNFTSTAP